MNHHHLHRVHARAADQVVSVIYVTATPTFTGAIGGYSTMGVEINTDEPAAPRPTPTSPVEIGGDQASDGKNSKPTALPTAITSPALKLSGSATAILAATGGLPSSAVLSADPPAATGSSASSDKNTGGGMSAGGTAALVIGILLLVGAILSIVLFYLRKKRKADEDAEASEHEKTEAGLQRSASVHSAASAPRLSLRPITQFLPNLGDKRASRASPSAALMAPVPEQRPSTAQSNHAENPFGNHAETVAPVQNPFGPHAETIDATNARGPVELGDAPPAVADAVPVAAPAGLQRGASKRENGSARMDLTKSVPSPGPASPAGTESNVSTATFGTPVQNAGGAAIATAGGPANSPVHRVQLDFNPSMSDELELKQGQLVRILHEYDDGWALCIRLDRSKQGVAPRTCLSTRPVKPRPQPPVQNGQAQAGPRGSPGMRGPPNGPQAALAVRPLSPNNPRGAPASPASARPQPGPHSPSGSTSSMESQRSGRSNSNTPPGNLAQRARSNSNAPSRIPQIQNRPRSNSSGQMPGPTLAQSAPSPTPSTPGHTGGSSPPGAPIRKPVPGQAL
ncbi:hypothetical protein B2J93_7594 [Marssonina coronariae]|uniref:SH3 domain-containing protein n=1 Tax=Diplocarpon coronariae TaxID=2795749 RepID=A0A218Z8R2_9HELO|nr:hypothetical protein B2J93_7594 [Marssonina coronariae]